MPTEVLRLHNPYIRFFDELSLKDVALVGGKNASLGELYRRLTAQGVRVPNGFATTADAFRLVLDRANAWDPLRAALARAGEGVEALAEGAAKAREIVRNAPFPPEAIRRATRSTRSRAKGRTPCATQAGPLTRGEGRMNGGGVRQRGRLPSVARPSHAAASFSIGT